MTGERPVDGVSPDALVAAHRAGYDAVVARLGAGRVLDVGCGTGFGTAQLAGGGREVVGIDYDFGAAHACSHRPAPALRAACMDGSRLGVRDRSVDWVCSSHVIEHFVRPEEHVRELARVVAGDGTVFVLCPNAPADLENPFHVSPFTKTDLQALLERHFDDATVHGIDGDETVKADFAERRRSARRLLSLDVFELRFKIPRRWYIGAYSLATRAMYRLQARAHSGAATGIEAANFHFVDDVVDDTLFLFAIGRSPRPVARAPR